MIIRIIQLLQNRNFILLSALGFAFLFPGGGKYLSDYTVYILALVMSFSLTGIQFKMLIQFKSVSKITIESFLLNFVLHGAVILLLAYFLADKASFLGFVVIAATPPGVAVIPFTYTFKGDLEYSFKGILGTYLLSIIIAPLIISIFAKNAILERDVLIFLIVKIIIIPLLLSRVLLLKKIFPTVEKIRGKVVDYGFALIIYTAVALNYNLLKSDFYPVITSSIILFAAIFISGITMLIIHRKKKYKKINISRNLMMTIKSSGFAVATALILFEQKSALPAAVMSIFVLFYLIFLNVYFKK